ncbi:MAG: hypothetical protein UX08_C0006G0007 [Candidatus Collierbacteria bacterium GW2011_GWB1_45_35]|uniref:Glycosyltransferase RgtA/B/C/D-like domain-containing protein n=1 Tax=Candidatus Collierbacteria bacterium GW2011_GWB2_45_17 TaxID=1618388 RepID=A0A837IGJ8_9BACT|nr:MAG: hypothetical protein UW48_C0005G0055 [Microgenomates group bacterium GW2011_GWC1_44_23]KKT95812.1 MAG: hypothetical protein UW96_C0004G0055 [Candidatus Collierbacteria bacterium GW2011_GWA1_45_15]KKU00244.1 MAG: hypothetical protein UX01_C0006G0038 [Candidatus Collierbacteria bacterium GW2011_GWB2_45_17]KKU05436.1 MAG: hypothetical protein UX08_C0006G0007 [Candidatus Collierbacteria bacterium GW2011_GWB1_45_35]KKU08674.1 MAG: hypothetical protein UX11_C0001G0014 [Candidatus Collierbacte
MLRKIFILLALFFFAATGQALAFKPETFVTFANPIRGTEGWQTPGQDPLALPLYQYNESTHSAFPITWLLRYDAVQDATMSAFFNNLVETDKNQSLGAFLEITPKLTEATNISYPPGISIFNANRIFLSGYTIQDRIKLIDTYMNAFFARFGSYPKSVSAWHLDSYSLQYLQSKYSVLTAMNCDDQYSTDKYRLWGGYLGSPYFPDKNNSLIPASSKENRVDLAMVRWAQRDLFNFYGYRSESAYSVQVNDYLNMGQDTKYFEKLINQYEQKFFNEFTYVNIGLENDYYLPNYKDEIKNVFITLKKNHDKFSLHPISLSDFGDWFKARYPVSSPAYFYQSTDLKLTDPGKVFWYQSPFYRIGLKSVNGETKIIDFRVYNRDIYEDNFATPNQSLDLFHEIPAVIDSIKFPGSELIMSIDMEKATPIHSKQWDNWEISFQLENKTLTLFPDKISFSGFTAPAITSKDIKVGREKNITTWNLTPFTPFKNTNSYTWLFWLLIVLITIFVAKKIKRSKGSSLREGTPTWLSWIPLAGKSHSTLIIGISVALLASLTVIRSGTLQSFGMGFWGPNGHDAVFHLSMIEKFAGAPFSLSHPQIAGEKISNYHFIFDFLSGIIVKIFGVSAINFYFMIFPVLTGLAIIFLLDKLLKSWNYSRAERLLALVLIFLAGSFGFIPKLLNGQDIFSGESAFWSNQSVSIFLNPPFALSIVVLLLFLNLHQSHSRPDRESIPTNHNLRTENYKLTTLFSLFLLGALLSQTKIYAFILLLGALLFSRKYKLFFGVLLLGGLISLPFITLGGTAPFLFSPLWFPRSLFASFDRFYWPQLVSAWQAYEASGNFVKLGLVNLFALAVFLLGNLGLRLIGLFEIYKTKSVTSSETIVRWIILFGLLLPTLFIQNVNPWNTIQFMYYALFFLAIFTAKALSKLNIYLLVPVLFLAILTSVGTLKDYIGFFSASRISYTELLALDKLRDQPKGIVLSPLFNQNDSRSIYAPKPLYSYVFTAYISAISGRPEFLSDTINLDITGFDYKEKARDIQRLYNTEDKQWGIEFLTKNNILYVYETPLQKLKLHPGDLNLKKIFDSGEINIYKFN